MKRIKSSEEMGVKYMQAWEEKVMEREKGKAEGKAEALLEILVEFGEVPDELCRHILVQRDQAICFLGDAA